MWEIFLKTNERIEIDKSIGGNFWYKVQIFLFLYVGDKMSVRIKFTLVKIASNNLL